MQRALTQWPYIKPRFFNNTLSLRGHVCPGSRPSQKLKKWISNDVGKENLAHKNDDSRDINNALRVRQLQFQQNQPLLRLERRYRATQAAQHFDRILKAASDEPRDLDVAESLWKTYCRAKRRVPNVLHALSAQAWDLLWQTQNLLANERPPAKGHVEQLLEDMSSIGRKSTLPQRLAKLATTFESGKTEEALALWEEEHDPKGTAAQDGLVPEHMELGIRMYASVGNFERAEHILDVLYGLYPSHDTKALMFVFNQRTLTGSLEDCHEAANVVEQHMRRIESTLGHRELLCLLAGFLRCGDIGKALIAFRDILHIRDSLDKSVLSPNDIGRILRNFFEICPLAEDANRVALELLLALPKSLHHVLFQLWLRRMLQLRDHDSIAMTVELMYERGLRPDHRHFNVLLEAFFRSGNPHLESKAEGLAWSMINCRSEFVMRPRSNLKGHGDSSVNVPFFLQRHVPAATKQTFVHLIRYYGAYRRQDEIDNVLEVMVKQEISVDTDIVNALLFTDLKRQDVQALWYRYQSYIVLDSHGKSLRPNGYTFVYLWKSLRIATFEDQNATDSIPSPRILLRDMVVWLQSMNPPEQRESELRRLEGGLTTKPRSRSFTSLVLRCFKHTRDLPGVFVALRVLRSEFRLRLTKTSVQAVLEQLAWVNLPDRTDASRRRRRGVEQFSHKLEAVEDMWRGLLKQRHDASQREVVATGLIGQDEQEAMAVEVLCQMIGMFLIRKTSREQFETDLSNAAREIGVTL